MVDAVAASLPSKLYFRIGEVAELVGVEPHVLRYWEREFRTIRPTKSAKGQRVYSRRDVENLMRVRELLYRDGFTIAGARKRLQQLPGENAQRESEAPGPVPPSDARPAEIAATEAARADSEPPPPSRSDRIDRSREELLGIRTEIVAFLAELDRPAS
jgi:DNA-binding transcriptional MerR regulator